MSPKDLFALHCIMAYHCNMKAITQAYLIASLLLLVAYAGKLSKNRIQHTITDSRGLTSVQFIEDGKEWGLDYLTAVQVDSLQKVLNSKISLTK